MVAIRTYAFSVLLLHVLAVVVTSSAAVTDSTARRTQLALEQQDLKYQKIDAQTYELFIDADEERRIVELLGPGYLDVGLIATRVTAPPRHCPVCGKTTEFVDWIFTALSRGIHSPGFIIESLKRGETPEKREHDVYCSGCGHLTGFRDSTGEEGSAPYLGLATPYDRATRTFADSIYKRKPDSPPVKRAASAGDAVVREQEVPDGRNRDYENNHKRDEDVPAKWGPVWICKKDDIESHGKGTAYPADEGAKLSPAEANVKVDVCKRSGGAIPEKRDLTSDAEDKDPSTSPGQDETAWSPRIYLIKRRVEDAANGLDEDTVDEQSPGAEPMAPTYAVWRPNWLERRDVENPTTASGLD
ncbi:hypothetical protein GY45DRAFT_1373644 [Cubamyces sp. BRFM 1775]|nr:hypothetical protein GY45DRAFT_1373644 [Cubamyces sp. BRFM 1775]